MAQWNYLMGYCICSPKLVKPCQLKSDTSNKIFVGFSRTQHYGSTKRGLSTQLKHLTQRLEDLLNL